MYLQALKENKSESDRRKLWVQDEDSHLLAQLF